MNIYTSETEYLKTEVQRLRALVRAQQITIDKLEAQSEQDMPKIGCVNHDCAQCKAQTEQKRPPNCGTGYCSCVECVMEPEKKFVSKVISTAPERIWLDLGFDPSNEDEISFDDLIEATWSHDNSTGFGIKYVRSDMTPSQRTWAGLTDEERRSIREWQRIQEELGPVWSPMMLYLYEAIEAKLKEKNT